MREVPEPRLEVDLCMAGLTAQEVARLLRDMAARIEESDWSGNLVIDGERVGGWSVAGRTTPRSSTTPVGWTKIMDGPDA